MSATEPALAHRRARLSSTWRMRLSLFVMLVVAVATVWVTNVWLTDRFTDSTRQRADQRLALYSANLVSELKRSSIVPQLRARDPSLIGALNSGDFQSSTQRLLSFQEEIDVAGLQLLDRDGRVVAATDRNLLDSSRADSEAFIDAQRATATVFTSAPSETGGYEFVYSRQLRSNNELIGVILVEVDLRQFQASWAGISEAVVVANTNDEFIMSTEPRWLTLSEEVALAVASAPSAIERAIRVTQGWGVSAADAYVAGRAVMRREVRVPFQGWRLISYTAYDSVRQRVNAVLALEIMGFAIFLALAFYFLSRRATSRLLFVQRESAELRALNKRLQREIAEREKVEKTLEVAEQTLAQSSKLAALGEMSAAVSHELNQPLAAMKTYLAGAKLLLQRKRPDEALSSFQRIDDLIGRMGAITRQLKSYARKGDEAFQPLDTRAAVSSALDMMEPQLKRREIRITKLLPDQPVMIEGDRLRLEQVIVNLLRNALDATQGVAAPEVDILLSAGDEVSLTIRDNGEGIDDLDQLFEPFYTTKRPGDGVGLGLAISSGIVSDLGGRLQARNGHGGGAVFELRLPIWTQDKDDTQRDQMHPGPQAAE